MIEKDRVSVAARVTIADRLNKYLPAIFIPRPPTRRHLYQTFCSEPIYFVKSAISRWPRGEARSLASRRRALEHDRPHDALNWCCDRARARHRTRRPRLG